jgi:pimeloyl-ACP methyl ester carboxylesterase/DNA-binding winged helix-turn-helix (wHTH) protein
MRFRFGDYELDLAQRELSLRGQPVAIESHVLELLGYLIRAHERAVPKRELLDAIWTTTRVSESSLTRAISLARAALREAPEAIRTLPRYGYRFAASVSELPGGAAGASARTGDPGPSRVRYAERDGVHIAFQTLGAGDHDIVLVPGWVLPMSSLLELPAARALIDELARLGRVVLFDKRGTGLSDRTGVAPPEERARDLAAVLDATGSERAVLLGVSEGGPLAITLAASHPSRVAALVLVGAFARLPRGPDHAHGWPHSELARLRYYIRHDWGRGLTLTALASAPDAELASWAARAEASGASPGAALALLEMNVELDVRALLPALRLPTLVLHTRDDPVIAVDNGRELGAGIAGARYVELPGRDHACLFEHRERLVAELRALLARPAPM